MVKHINIHRLPYTAVSGAILLATSGLFSVYGDQGSSGANRATAGTAVVTGGSTDVFRPRGVTPTTARLPIPGQPSAEPRPKLAPLP
jgi:hypothetical protein